MREYIYLRLKGGYLRIQLECTGNILSNQYRETVHKRNQQQGRSEDGRTTLPSRRPKHIEKKQYQCDHFEYLDSSGIKINTAPPPTTIPHLKKVEIFFPETHKI
ncbi:MAG: hypothetical protein E2O82_03595, partial [Betaproteobacteria bacterium]